MRTGEKKRRAGEDSEGERDGRKKREREGKKELESD